jgi:hypothetical protein
MKDRGVRGQNVALRSGSGVFFLFVRMIAINIGFDDCKNRSI